MTPIERSRRTRVGLAGLSAFSALGAALGLGLSAPAQAATHATTPGSPATTGTRPSHSPRDVTSQPSTPEPRHPGPVTAPIGALADAVTRGS